MYGQEQMKDKVGLRTPLQLNVFVHQLSACISQASDPAATAVPAVFVQVGKAAPQESVHTVSAASHPMDVTHALTSLLLQGLQNSCPSPSPHGCCHLCST